MQQYYDARVDWPTLQTLHPGLTADAASFKADHVRPKLLAAESYEPERICRYALRPFDMRWCYYSEVSPLWNRARPMLRAQCRQDNAFLLSRPTGVATPEGVPMAFTRTLGDNDFLRGHAYYFPLLLYPPCEKRGKTPDEASPSRPRANLSPAARAYLAALAITDVDSCVQSASLIWMHALAIGFTPAYLAENADGIRSHWLRLPLPNCPSLLLASAALGRQVAALSDIDQPVGGVTFGDMPPDLRAVAVLMQGSGEALNPNADDLAITAGWGHAHNRATMPGKGKVVERAYTSGEHAALQARAQQLGLTTAHIRHLLGTTTYDIYLHDGAYWTNIPRNVWGYTIGGYQVLKKWLSYREHDVLGHPLTPGEACDVMHMARRLAALLLLTPALETNYDRIKNACSAWPPADVSGPA